MTPMAAGPVERRAIELALSHRRRATRSRFGRPQPRRQRRPDEDDRSHRRVLAARPRTRAGNSGGAGPIRGRERPAAPPGSRTPAGSDRRRRTRSIPTATQPARAPSADPRPDRRQQSSARPETNPARFARQRVEQRVADLALRRAPRIPPATGRREYRRYRSGASAPPRSAPAPARSPRSAMAAGAVKTAQPARIARGTGHGCRRERRRCRYRS